MFFERRIFCKINTCPAPNGSDHVVRLLSICREFPSNQFRELVASCPVRVTSTGRICEVQTSKSPRRPPKLYLCILFCCELNYGRRHGENHPPYFATALHGHFTLARDLQDLDASIRTYPYKPEHAQSIYTSRSLQARSKNCS